MWLILSTRLRRYKYGHDLVGMAYNMFTLTSFVSDITQSLYINLDVEGCSFIHRCITLELFNFSSTQAPTNVSLESAPVQ